MSLLQFWLENGKHLTSIWLDLELEFASWKTTTSHGQLRTQLNSRQLLMYSENEYQFYDQFFYIYVDKTSQ